MGPILSVVNSDSSRSHSGQGLYGSFCRDPPSDSLGHPLVVASLFEFVEFGFTEHVACIALSNRCTGTLFVHAFVGETVESVFLGEGPELRHSKASKLEHVAWSWYVDVVTSPPRDVHQAVYSPSQGWEMLLWKWTKAARGPRRRPWCGVLQPEMLLPRPAVGRSSALRWRRGTRFL